MKKEQCCSCKSMLQTSNFLQEANSIIEYAQNVN